jgi:hypothetical protein
VESLIVIAILMIIGLIIFSAFAISEYSVSNYDYEPFQILNLAILTIPCLVSIIMLYEFEHNSIGHADYKDLNHIVLYLFMIVSCVIVCGLIYSHTKNIIIALYSTILLFIGAIFIAIIIIWAILAAVSKWERNKK